MSTPDPVIVRGLWKRFSPGSSRVPAITMLRRALSPDDGDSEEFYALKDIGFALRPEEKIGLIGNNGAGKTTLLKVLSGIYLPTRGRVRVDGRITLLAGLGLGMVEELTVEQNLYLYGAIYGMERATVRERSAEILEWAELEAFAGSKLKTLSRGMKTRLAFSATRHVDADVWLMDEALSAGDQSFREKCDEVFEGYKRSSKSFVIASHSMAFIRQFCSRTLWLHGGRQMAFDDTEAVLEQYEQFNARGKSP